MGRQSRAPKRRRRRRLPKDPNSSWVEPRRCVHKWSVFVAGHDDRPWCYCLKCGRLHPGELADQPGFGRV